MANVDEESANNFAFASACVKLHSGFVSRTCQNLLMECVVGTREETLCLLSARLALWLQSLSKLLSPGDYQAHAAGMRATLELTTDCCLLGYSANPTEDDAAIREWEDSARLKHSEGLVRLREGQAEQPFLGAFENPRSWVAREGPRIRASRARRWGGDHPKRWTRRDLGTDCERADTLRPDQSEGSPRFQGGPRGPKGKGQYRSNPASMRDCVWSGREDLNLRPLAPEARSGCCPEGLTLATRRICRICRMRRQALGG